MLVPVLILTAAMNQPRAVSGAADLVLEPVISEAEYCREAGGEIALHLRFILHYQNATQTPIVLPMFDLLTRYELFSDDAALKLNRPNADISFHRDHALDATKLDASTPDPKLFRILRPGEIASSYGSLSIVVQPVHADLPSLLGKDYYLRVHMNPWPAERKTGEKLRTLWQRFGVLRMAEIPSLPLNLHVEHRPRPDVCRLSID